MDIKIEQHANSLVIICVYIYSGVLPLCLQLSSYL